MAERPNLPHLPSETLTRILEYNENWNLVTTNTALMRLSIAVFKGRLEKHFHIPSQLREEIREIIRTERLPLVRTIYLLKNQYKHFKDLTDKAYRRFVTQDLENAHDNFHGFGDIVPDLSLHDAFDVLATYEKTWYRNDDSWARVPAAFVAMYTHHHHVVATVNWGEDGLKSHMTNPGMFVLIWSLLVTSAVVTGDAYVRAGEPLHDTLWKFMENPGMVAQDDSFIGSFITNLSNIFVRPEGVILNLDWKRRTMTSFIVFMALVPDVVVNPDRPNEFTVPKLRMLCDAWSREDNSNMDGFVELRVRANGLANPRAIGSDDSFSDPDELFLD